MDDTLDPSLKKSINTLKLSKLSSKPLFKGLLCNFTKYTVFSFNGHLYKPIDGCGMGNPLSLGLASIFMAKLELHVDVAL